jgi:16S rRNA (cytosine967-C5)-methyltransferase
MRIVKNVSKARFLAFQAIQKMETKDAYLDIVLNNYQQAKILDQPDRALLNELVRGVVRWKKKLDWIIEQLKQRDKELDPRIRWILWLGIYQLLYLDKIPQYAIVNESVELAKRIGRKHVAGFVNGLLRAFIRNPDAITMPDINANPVKTIAITESHPEWLVKKWVKEYGTEFTQKICQANNTIPPVTVRPNLNIQTIADFENKLDENTISYSKSQLDFFYNIDHLSKALDLLIQQGICTVQDAGAGLVSYVASPGENDVIVDVCAAPGGKSTHCAELTHDRARVLSGDIQFNRIKKIVKAKERLSLKSVFPILADACAFPVKRANVVIVDAPCTGLGVIRKKPDIKWHRSPKDIEDMSKIQKDILNASGHLVKTGGKLLYSTCTTTEEENENVVEHFLKHNPDFSLSRELNQHVESEWLTPKGYIRTWPHLHEMDASFIAKLIRN